MGDKGKAMVLVFASLEFFGAVCMSLIVIYKQIESFLPASGALCIANQTRPPSWWYCIDSQSFVIAATCNTALLPQGFSASRLYSRQQLSPL